MSSAGCRVPRVGAHAMEDLERRLLRLRGESPPDAVTEESLRRRFRAMKGPESPCGMSHAQLAERFNKIFGSSSGQGSHECNDIAGGTPASPLDEAVEAYLEAARESADQEELGGAMSGWAEMDMVFHSFVGSGIAHGSGNDDMVAALLEEAQGAVRLSAKDNQCHTSTDYVSSDDETNEDAAVARIVQASREEAALELKYSGDHSRPSPSKVRRRRKRKQKKRRNRKRGRDSDSSNSSVSGSSGGSSDSSGSERDVSCGESDSSDSDGNMNCRKKGRPESKEDEYRREEADTLKRLKLAMREEGKDSELVRVLAKRVIFLRNSRKRGARLQALRVPLVM